jgi:DNA invertase Pin-like site-specific DNA recombinase
LPSWLRSGKAQAEATKIAQRAGIERAKASIDKPYRGRKPSYTRKQFEVARTLLGQERVNVGAIAEETGLSRQTVYRIKDDPAAAEAALGTWGL